MDSRMSVHYTFYHRVGFNVSVEHLKQVFGHKNVTHEEGSFHMEDRFDPKTGVKLDPVKVWDKKPKTHTERWWIIDGERFDDWEDDPMTRVFEEKLGCHVDYYRQADGGEDPSFGFYLHDPNNDDQIDEGKFAIHNLTMDYAAVCAMQPKLAELKQKLQAMGIDPGEAQVFLGEISG
jgi:hypothetical protein